MYVAASIRVRGINYDFPILQNYITPCQLIIANRKCLTTSFLHRAGC